MSEHPYSMGPAATPFGGLAPPGREARVRILPIPYDLTTSYEPGTRWGPEAILRASLQLESYDEETGRDLEEARVETLAPLEPVASGPREMVAAVAAACRVLGQDGRPLILLGGEHTLTLGALQAHKEAGRSLQVLQLDAHADLRPTYQGSPYSHACVMARVAELFPILQVGLRSLSREESRRLDRRGVLWAREIHADLEGSLRRLDGLLHERVYITIDLDVLDPSLLPSTGTPEPGGLDWLQMTAILRHVGRTRAVVGMDLMEHSPRPGFHAADFVAARLLAKAILYCWGGKDPPQGG